MPRFFFDTDDGTRQYEDDHGVEIVDADQARREASSLLSDLAHAGVLEDGKPRVITASVRDAMGVEIYRAAMILRLPDRVSGL